MKALRYGAEVSYDKQEPIYAAGGADLEQNDEFAETIRSGSPSNIEQQKAVGGLQLDHQ
jgi:hypothetical protein